MRKFESSYVCPADESVGSKTSLTHRFNCGGLQQRADTGCIIFIFVFLFTYPIFSQTNDFKPVKNETDFRSEMLKIQASTQTLQSEFTQEKHLSFMSEPIVTKGHFYYKKDKKLRWEYVKPFAYTVILNGSDLMINDEGHRNEIDLKSNKTYKEINEVISGSMRGDLDSGKVEFDSILKENNRFYLLELKPKKKQIKEYMTRIEVYFDKKDFLISKVIMHEQGSDLTKIFFKNKKINQTISENLFQL